MSHQLHSTGGRSTGLAPAPSLEEESGDKVVRLSQEFAGSQLADTSADDAHDGDGISRWQPVQFLSRSPGSRVFPSAVVHGGNLYVFGGHDGQVYRNDLLVFNFDTRCWRTELETSGDAPNPRDAHAAVVYADWMCVFGGYDSKRYLNDFHRFHFGTATWSPIVAASGTPPSPRGGHTAVVHRELMFVFGGCDGWSYFNDCYAFNFVRAEWSAVRITGTAPGARSAPATVVHPGRNCMYVFGGYDGARSLNDLFRFNLDTSEWTHVRTSGTPPSPRGGHTAVVHKDMLYAFGGKSGRSPFNDLCGFSFETSTWTAIRLSAPAPAPRCAHVCVVQDSSLYVFGGYDGRRYFDDCFEYNFEPPLASALFSLAGDLEQMVNNDQFSDIRFRVDGHVVHAHKTILFARSEYFRRMLTGGYREAADEVIEIQAVGHDAFLCVLSFLYTGKLPREFRQALSPQLAVDLLGVANLYGIEPLKRLCADIITRNLHPENAAAVLEAAEAHGTPQLRAACTDFIIANFGAVVRSDAFRELIRAETRDLVLHILVELAERGAGPSSTAILGGIGSGALVASGTSSAAAVGMGGGSGGGLSVGHRDASARLGGPVSTGTPAPRLRSRHL